MAANPLFAQTAGGSVSGTVTGPGGAVLSGVTVRVKDLNTDWSRTATTDRNGVYRVTAFPVGELQVTAEKNGFKRSVRTGIHLDVGQDAVVDLQMQLGTLRQELTVSSEAPLVSVAMDERTGFVGQQTVEDLPLNGRSWDNLVALNPGAIKYNLKSANTTTSNGNTFTIDGRRTTDNLVLLNGVEDPGASLFGVSPGGVGGGLLGVGAVREFNVLTGWYPASYGKRSGGQVVVVTRSGTNALHGSAYEFLRNSAVDARNYFDTGDVPPLRRNQFGGALGGPLRKNSWFLFGNYEALRQSLSLSNVAVVPDDQTRQGLLPDAGGAYRPAPGLDPFMLKYMTLWPKANGAELTVAGKPSGTALSFGSPKEKVREDFGTLRSDYHIRSRDQLSASYTIQNGDDQTPMEDPLFGSDRHLVTQVGTLQEVHILSPHAINTFRGGLSRAAFLDTSFPLVPFPPEVAFVEGGDPGGIVISGGLTTTGLAGITAAGPNNASDVVRVRNLFTWSDDLEITAGKHQISAGVWFQRVQDNANSATTTLGQVNFDSLQTFLQGTLSNFNITPSRTELGWRTLLGAWYVSDQIRLRPNLTAEIGLRDEFTTGWNEVAGRAANYITDANGVLETNPRVGASAFTKNRATSLWGPRVGLAWDPLGKGTTVVHAGFGIYYSLLDSLTRLNGIPPFNGSLAFSDVPLRSIVPINPATPPQPSCGPGLLTGCLIYEPQGVQPDAYTPTVERWTFRLDRQIGPSTVLRIGYVGSFGYHALVSIDANSIPSQVCQLAAGCVSGGMGRARGFVPSGTEYIPVSTGRPNPYLSAGFFWYSEGNSSYHALQLDLVHRLQHGLSIRGNLTWSKNLDIGSALQGAQAKNESQMVMDRGNIARDWGPSALDAALQSSISGSYLLPLGKGRQFFAHSPGFVNALISGWELNGIVTAMSGFPFTPQLGSNRAGDGDTRHPDRPSVNPDFNGAVILGKQAQWFDPRAFVLPQPGTWGDLGRGVYRGPGLVDIDLSLFKNIPLSERTRLQFRAECFNLANHANFGTPNAIVFSGADINPSAGLITDTVTTSRQLQFGLKLTF